MVSSTGGVERELATGLRNSSPVPASKKSAPMTSRVERPVPRRGLSRIEAAMYLGISPSKFDELVRGGRMPKPKRIDTRKVWDLYQLDLAFDELPDEGNSWDDV
jgi:predicted DNA-binding transcriptional regulator AlpA